MTQRASLLALLVATGLAAAACGGSSHTGPAPTLTTPPATIPTTPTTTTTQSTGTTSSTPTPSGAAPSHSPATPAGSSPTPEQVAKAKAALAVCQKENPGITLKQLEQEAASPQGIQC